MKTIVIFVIVAILLACLFFRNTQENFAKEEKHGDIITLYYAPWCSHSVTFLPIWEEFIKRNSKNITIETVNCDEKQCPPVNGFPAVILRRVNMNQIQYFDKERTLDNLEKFIA